MDDWYMTFPFGDDTTVLEDGDFAVCHCDNRHLCGYCAIPAKDIPKEWHGDYDADALQYLRIHGGITYCHVDGDKVVFGFDCAHAGDDKRDDLKDPEFVLGHAKTMKRLLLEYAARIHEWRGATCNQRCQILDDINRGVDEQLGFGALIDVLGGVSKLKRGDDLNQGDNG